MRYVCLADYLEIIKKNIEADEDIWFPENNSKLRVAGYRYLGHGRGRITFRRNGTNWVLKIPYVKIGVTDNKVEAQLYSKNKGIMFPEVEKPTERGRLAKCKLVTINGVSCLRMEYLRRPARSERFGLPIWTWNLYDGRQVGFDRKGRVKVYDYALEIEELDPHQKAVEEGEDWAAR